MDKPFSFSFLLAVKLDFTLVIIAKKTSGKLESFLQSPEAYLLCSKDTICNLKYHVKKKKPTTSAFPNRGYTFLRIKASNLVKQHGIHIISR